MFKVIGVLVGIYTVYAVYSGEVYAKKGPGGERVCKQARPGYYWTVIGIYTALSLALVFLF